MDKENQLKKLQEQLDALKIFPKTKLVRQLQKQILDKIKSTQKTKSPKKPTDSKRLANESRSRKLKRYHRYVRLIRDNFPDLTIAEIRKQFSKRRKGTEVSIPDAVWQNPSP